MKLKKVKLWTDIRSQNLLSKNHVGTNWGVEIGNGLGKVDKHGGNEEDMKQGRR